MTVPDVITIFRGPLERAFPDPAELRAEIRNHLAARIAHHLGIEEGSGSRNWVSLMKMNIAGRELAGDAETDRDENSASGPGVFSSIADGFSIAIWRPMIIVIPVLLDAYYGWVGSSKPARLRFSCNAGWWTRASIAPTEFPRDLAASRNGMWRRRPSFFFVPSLLSGVNPSRLYHFDQRGVFDSPLGFDLAILIAAFLLKHGSFRCFWKRSGRRFATANRPLPARNS